MKQLLARAAALGISVHVWQLDRDVNGLYDDLERIIYLTLGLTIPEQRSTLAHELGHARYGHDCTNAKAERQARAYAAALLIDPVEYAYLERINADQHWIADELMVTPRIIFDYERYCLTRLRGVTYARAKMGIGQWAFKLEPAG